MTDNTPSVRERLIAALRRQPWELIVPNEFGEREIDYEAAADAILTEVQLDGSAEVPRG